MINFKKHITILGVLVFLLPTMTKLVHSFKNHRHHTSCSSVKKEKEHFNQKESSDCKVCDFTFLSFVSNDSDSLIIIYKKSFHLFSDTYISISDFNKLYLSLRAPPIFI